MRKANKNYLHTVLCSWYHTDLCVQLNQRKEANFQNSLEYSDKPDGLAGWQKFKFLDLLNDSFLVAVPD